MYAPILDRELKKAEEFKLQVDYYVKNGNGNYYTGQLENLDCWHSINTADGIKRVQGRDIIGVGINSDHKIFEKDENSSLVLPKFPESFIFGEKEVKTDDLTKEEIKLILYRWK